MMNPSYLMVVGLNPSTADEVQDDPTIRRCIDFAKRWGYGALCMTNIFAYRATLPKDMKMAMNPIGEENDYWLGSCAKDAGMVLGAWGRHGSFMGRAEYVQRMLVFAADARFQWQRDSLPQAKRGWQSQSSPLHEGRHNADNPMTNSHSQFMKNHRTARASTKPRPSGWTDWCIRDSLGIELTHPTIITRGFEKSKGAALRLAGIAAKAYNRDPKQ